MKVIVTSLAIFVIAGAIIACGGASNNTTNNVVNKMTSTPVAANTTTTTTTNTTAKTETTSADKSGVPECDDYIAKLEACLNSKVPEAFRGAFKAQAEALKKEWKDAAATPYGKAGLAVSCKAASDAAKTSLSAYNCSW